MAEARQPRLGVDSNKAQPRPPALDTLALNKQASGKPVRHKRNEVSQRWQSPHRPQRFPLPPAQQATPGLATFQEPQLRARLRLRSLISSLFSYLPFSKYSFPSNHQYGGESEILRMQRTGSLSLDYSGPGIERQHVPSAAFSCACDGR